MPIGGTHYQIGLREIEWANLALCVAGNLGSRQFEAPGAVR
jgi:hypothetical protein